MSLSKMRLYPEPSGIGGASAINVWREARERGAAAPEPLKKGSIGASIALQTDASARTLNVVFGETLDELPVSGDHLAHWHHGITGSTVTGPYKTATIWAAL